MWNQIKNIFKSVKNLFENNNEFKSFQNELEVLLISQDVNIKTAQKLVNSLSPSLSSDEIIEELKGAIAKILLPCEKKFKSPNVPLATILFCGVNGGGKTTTIAKMAHYLAKNNKVGMVAADTFRAAAIEQLVAWGNKLSVPVFTGTLNSDPASIIFQSIDWAQEQKLNMLLIDTAGRLQNKKNLMEELSKIKRVIQKQIPNGPHETILVLDGTTGSNILSQTEIFNSVTPLTGIVMTKLDGTARGGGLISLAAQFKLPIYFLGTGEKVNDLEPFSAEKFSSDLLDNSSL